MPANLVIAAVFVVLLLVAVVVKLIKTRHYTLEEAREILKGSTLFCDADNDEMTCHRWTMTTITLSGGDSYDLVATGLRSKAADQADHSTYRVIMSSKSLRRETTFVDDDALELFELGKTEAA